MDNTPATVARFVALGKCRDASLHRQRAEEHNKRWRNVGFAEGGARGGRKNRTTEQIIEPDEIVLFGSFKRDGQRSHADGLCEIQEVCVISNDPTGSAANSLIPLGEKVALKARIPYAIARFFFAQDVPIDQSPQGSLHRLMAHGPGNEQLSSIEVSRRPA